jgi:hypothetical protein
VWLCCINRQAIDFAINYFAYDLIQAIKNKNLGFICATKPKRM